MSGADGAGPADGAPRRRGHASAHDVARLAGVSQAAVSRAFTQGASISPATRDKVLSAARTLNYQPNLLARSLITGRSGMIGVIIGSPRNPFFLEAFEALSDRLAEAGLHLLVFTARGEDRVTALVEDLLKFRVQALLMMSAGLEPGLAEQIRAAGVPIIFFNRRARLVEGFASVAGANYLGAQQIAAHLLAQGYRRPAFLSGAESSLTNREREAGFTAHLLAAGLPLPERAVGDYELEGAAAATRALLALDPRPDAIFCASDSMAFRAIEVARYEYGLEIGRALGVAGFDDIEGASWPSWSLTTYSQPVGPMTDRVVEILLNPGDHADAPHFTVAGELIVRNSTRRA